MRFSLSVLMLIDRGLRFVSNRLRAIGWKLETAAQRVTVYRQGMVRTKAAKQPMVWSLVGGRVVGEYDCDRLVRARWPVVDEFKFGELRRFFVGLNPVAEAMPDPNRDGAWRLFMREDRPA